MQMGDQLGVLFKEVVTGCRKVEVLKNILFYAPETLVQTIFNQPSFCSLSLVIKYPNLTSTSIQSFLHLFFPTLDHITQQTLRQSICPEILSSSPIEHSHNINQDYSLILQLLIKSVWQKGQSKEKLTVFVIENQEEITGKYFQILDGRVGEKECLEFLNEGKLNLSQLEIELVKKQLFVGQNEEGKYWRLFEEELDVNSKILESTLSQSKKTIESRLSEKTEDIPQGVEILKQLILITLDRFVEIKGMMIKFTTEVSFDVFEQLLIEGYRQFLSTLNPFDTEFLQSEKCKIQLLKKRDFDMRQFINVMSILGVNEMYERGLEMFFRKFEKNGLLEFKTIYTMFVHSDVQLTFSASHKTNNFIPLLQHYLSLLEQQSLIKQSLKSLGIEEVIKTFQYLNTNQLDTVNEKEISNLLELDESKSLDLRYCLISLFGVEEVSLKRFVSQLIIYD